MRYLRWLGGVVVRALDS